MRQTGTGRDFSNSRETMAKATVVHQGFPAAVRTLRICVVLIRHGRCLTGQCPSRSRGRRAAGMQGDLAAKYAGHMGPTRPPLPKPAAAGSRRTCVRLIACLWQPPKTHAYLGIGGTCCGPQPLRGQNVVGCRYSHVVNVAEQRTAVGAVGPQPFRPWRLSSNRQPQSQSSHRPARAHTGQADTNQRERRRFRHLAGRGGIRGHQRQQPVDVVGYARRIRERQGCRRRLGREGVAVQREQCVELARAAPDSARTTTVAKAPRKMRIMG
jgi:hypothetical protein